MCKYEIERGRFHTIIRQFLPLLLSLASVWKLMKSQWKLLLYGKELVRSQQDNCTKMTSLTLRFTSWNLLIYDYEVASLG